MAECIHWKGGGEAPCSLLKVDRCNPLCCKFKKTRLEQIEAVQKKRRRLRSLDKAEQFGIAAAYYDCKAWWNESTREITKI